MNTYEINNLEKILKENSYLGRGIIIGKSEDGKNAVILYFIMGRSENSRNRIFSFKDDVLYTEPFDKNKTINPELIIYRALREYKNKLIITNGDHTDTIYEGLKKGIDFSESLKIRKFEPDAPNFTARISGILYFKNNDFSYKMSILKSADKKGTACDKYIFDYESLCGEGRFIHTYSGDGNPLPPFYGEPKRIKIPNDMDEFASKI
ncbi:IMP cyclohydrolase [Brachyspira catarrhinii]|uniref:IMP cyclohydrolase n=1 Tax=Brachyspira catarrhinii TaxID=2528966 RepID=UPI00191D23F3|nr:IMP cyclohydrolase [Brachyspira catarrhinii]